jgi:hypothetical protein
LVAALIAVSVIAAFAVVRSGSSSWARPSTDAVVPERGVGVRDASGRSPLSPAAGPETAYVKPAGQTSPVSHVAREDPPARSGERAQVQQTSAGQACRITTMESEYGSYPLARCRMWQRSVGLLSGETLAKGGTSVTCQRDLGRANPQYTNGQSNTWWIWTKSDAGTWDWFPQTAVAQGVSDQPINGIALCHDPG